MAGSEKTNATSTNRQSPQCTTPFFATFQIITAAISEGKATILPNAA